MADDPRVAAVHELLPFTRWTIVDMEPASLERVAAYLAGLLEREPLRSGRGWEHERIVLGCFVTDLRTIVREAGEPIGAARDLRDARTKADERAARARMEQAVRAYDELITDAIEQDRAQRARREREETRDHVPAQLTPDPAPAPATPPAAASDEISVPWI